MRTRKSIIEVVVGVGVPALVIGSILLARMRGLKEANKAGYTVRDPTLDSQISQEKLTSSGATYEVLETHVAYSFDDAILLAKNELNQAKAVSKKDSLKTLVSELEDIKRTGKIQQNEKYPTAIRAAHLQHDSTVRLLVSTGADVNSRSFDGTTLLMTVAYKGRPATVAFLLNRGANVHTKNDFDRTALFNAAEGGNESIVELLIGKGANVNARRIDGMSALMIASEKGFNKIVDLLINSGANVNEIDNEGLTAFELAKINKHSNVMKILTFHGAKQVKQDFSASAPKGFTYYDAISLIEKEMLVCSDSKKKTYLARYKSSIERIIQSPDEIKNFDHGGGEALIFATMFGHYSVVKILVNGGVNVNACDATGMTALWHAIGFRRKLISELLIANNADVNKSVEGMGGMTILMWAAANNSPSIVSLLIDKGADINSKDYHFYTALMHASLFGHEKIVRLLLERGADKGKEGDRLTPLRIAIDEDYTIIENLLRQYGAK
jgi:serine/threonine-protein phosphatase 6 regulatory ankyrin repeat subunit B